MEASYVCHIDYSACLLVPFEAAIVVISPKSLRLQSMLGMHQSLMVGRRRTQRLWMHAMSETFSSGCLG